MKIISVVIFIGLCCLNSLNAQDSIQAKDDTQTINQFVKSGLDAKINQKP